MRIFLSFLALFLSPPLSLSVSSSPLFLLIYSAKLDMFLARGRSDDFNYKCSGKLKEGNCIVGVNLTSLLNMVDQVPSCPT